MNFNDKYNDDFDNYLAELVFQLAPLLIVKPNHFLSKSHELS